MAELTQQSLALAVRHHTAGRLQQAIAIYRDLLRAAPRDADVMQRLGVAFAQLGAPDRGAQYLAASLELSPDRPPVLLNLARALLALGRADPALGCCDRALQLDGSMMDGHRLRGSALVALGRHEEALASLGQAVKLAPTDPAALVDLGVALGACGRAQDAMLCFKRAVELDPRQTPAHHNLGLLAARQGDQQAALESFEHALALEPANAALHINRGTTLKELGRLPDALQSYSAALAILPRNVDAVRNRAVVNLLLQNHAAALADYEQSLALGGERPQDLIGRGATLIALGRHAEALPLLERAAVLLPMEIDAHVQLGVALLRLERHAEAIARFDQALAIERHRPEVLTNRGSALAALGRLDEALENFIEAAAKGAGTADAHTNVGVVFKSLGDYAQAGHAFDRALSLKRNDAAASFESALLHLTLGDFRRGWPLYEARLRVPAFAPAERDFAMPRWDGREPLAGRTLLVHAEQGLGDTIQFGRYLPLLVEQGATVAFEVMPQLRALMASLSSAVRMVPRGEALPRADFHCPLLSLPLAFDTQPDSIPASVPYLSSEPARRAFWSTRLQRLGGLRVGIAWQGNLRVERLMWARGRSMPLTALAPLADVAGVSLVSLQKGPGSEQLREVAFRDRILDLGPELDAGPDGFLDSAAVMSHLDLVISTDTAIVHLAGALGRPVWVALEAQADWRWLLNRHDSPWYPTMRLFRQPVRNGGWEAVVADLATALEALAGAR